MIIYSGKKDIDKVIETLKGLSKTNNKKMTKDYVNSVAKILEHSGPTLIAYFYERLAGEGLLNFYSENLKKEAENET